MWRVGKADAGAEAGDRPSQKRSGLCEGQVRSSLAHSGCKQIVRPLCQELGTQEWQSGAGEAGGWDPVSAGLEGMESPLRVGLCALLWGAARSAEDVPHWEGHQLAPQAKSHPNFSCFITGGQTVEEASSAPKNDLVPEDRALGTTESLEPNAMDGEAEA